MLTGQQRRPWKAISTAHPQIRRRRILCTLKTRNNRGHIHGSQGLDQTLGKPEKCKRSGNMVGITNETNAWVAGAATSNSSRRQRRVLCFYIYGDASVDQNRVEKKVREESEEASRGLQKTGGKGFWGSQQIHCD